jgi:hypothetical protein
MLMFALLSPLEDIMYMEKIEKLIFVFNDTKNPDNDVTLKITRSMGHELP